MQNTKNRPLKILLRFSMVGVGNTLVDICVFVFLTRFGVYYLIAHLLSYGTGMVNSYVWNRLWTFQVETKVNPKEITRFIIVNLSSLSTSFILLFILKQNEAFPLIFSKIFATLGGLFINFIGNRLWVFKQS